MSALTSVSWFRFIRSKKNKETGLYICRNIHLSYFDSNSFLWLEEENVENYRYKLESCCFT